jgi:signal transduction histidine kinase
VTERVATFAVERPDDIFVLRQSGRVAAAAIGCDDADQVRLATALSELGREALAHGSKAGVTLAVSGDGALLVDIANFPHTVVANGAGSSVEAARKLVGEVTVSGDGSGGIVSVHLRHRAPAASAKVSAASVRAALARTATRGPLDALRLENRNLIATLSELRERQEQLVRLNAELQETNHGVMAMYAQLADELDETNRGVVALYAELDDKTVRLNAASDSKSRFLASVSHELRSPLNSILGLANLLLDDAADGSGDRPKQLQLIRASAGELLELVNELLDLAKAESGRLQPTVSRVEIAEVFAELRGALRPLARPGVDLRIEINGRAAIETDRTLLVHVLRNLLTNALKFTISGGVVLAARDVTPYEVELSVADTGIGIAPDDQTRIFDEFYQIRGPLQADHKGTGLGLPYARRVTATLGGSMSLESRPGLGSVFAIRLPAQWQPMLAAPQSPGKQPAAAPRVSTVLVVDDDPGCRRTVRGLLQGVAGQILEARGGTEGLEMMRGERPDLVFLDLRMPDLDGTDVLRTMRDDPVLRGIPVVVVTAAELEAESPARLEHATAVMSKVSLSKESIARMLGAAFGSAEAVS